MSRIRILHIVQCAGGVERYLHMLLKYMDRDRFEQILVCSTEYSREVYAPLVDAFEAVEMRHSLSPLADIKAMYAVRRIVRRTRPDVVYCHSSKAGGIGRLACAGLRIPVLYNPHGWAFSMKGTKMMSLVYLLIERALSVLTTRFVVISNFEKLTAVQHHVARSGKIIVIFNGIDLQDVWAQQVCTEVTRAEIGIPEEAYIVGMVGRLCAQKAPDVFVRMAADVLSRIPEAWFLMVGGGEEKEAVLRLAAELGVADRLRITGWVENPVAYAALFDQAVLLSRWEGFGLVLAEYMSLRKPIVATRVDAIPDLIVDEENGLLVEMDDVGQAVSAVCRLYDDKDLRERLVLDGERRVQTLFDVRRVAREHERLFDRIYKIRGGDGIRIGLRGRVSRRIFRRNTKS